MLHINSLRPVPLAFLVTLIGCAPDVPFPIECAQGASACGANSCEGECTATYRDRGSVGRPGVHNWIGASKFNFHIGADGAARGALVYKEFETSEDAQVLGTGKFEVRLATHSEDGDSPNWVEFARTDLDLDVPGLGEPEYPEIFPGFAAGEAMAITSGGTHFRIRGSSVRSVNIPGDGHYFQSEEDGGLVVWNFEGRLHVGQIVEGCLVVQAAIDCPFALDHPRIQKAAPTAQEAVIVYGATSQDEVVAFTLENWKLVETREILLSESLSDDNVISWNDDGNSLLHCFGDSCGRWTEDAGWAVQAFNRPASVFILLADGQVPYLSRDLEDTVVCENDLYRYVEGEWELLGRADYCSGTKMAVDRESTFYHQSPNNRALVTLKFE